MATTTSSEPRSNEDYFIHRPRPMKPKNPSVLGTQSMESRLSARPDIASGVSSGRSTPIPSDAPPSTKSLSSARKQIRAQQKRLFPTVEYAERLSHFDPRSEYSDFRGFFVLFWVGLAIMVITTMLRNIKETGTPIQARPWALFTVNAVQLGLSDAVMVLSTAVVLPMQRIFRESTGVLRWSKLGMPIHVVFEAIWLTLWVNWPFMMSWTWTAQVFLTLHTIVLLMKIHSYAFYNGHLSYTEDRLNSLDNPAENPSTVAAVRYPRSDTRLNEMSEKLHEEEGKSQEQQDHEDKEDALKQLREDLAMELTSPLGRVTFPQNLTLGNYVDYILCPTLCYELEYPRTPRTQWSELCYKTLAVFGCIFLLTITSEEFIVPVLNDSAFRLAHATRISDKALVLAETTSWLLFPFMVTFLLVFLVIFEYVLGAFAEITCFADRHFYSDWWNSCDWLEFSREWNKPVHHFLHRHVYGASKPYMSRGMSTAVTFLISALLHELIMGCITKKLRGYGFVAMMLQIPLVAVQRSKLLKGKPLFNNVCFWISMIMGLSIMCALYVLV